MIKLSNFKKIRIAIYVRVSTQEQAKEGYSINEQIDRLKKYADAHGWIVVKIYTDAGHSGANQERPALQDMILDVQAGRIDKVLVYKLDRLSRSQKDTLELIEDVFLKNDCDFESMTEKFDTSTSFGRAMVGILAVFAQLEREQIKERMSMGIEARMKEGKWRGGKSVPFGYDYEPALEKLVVNEYEAMIVRFIFNEYAEGKSFYYMVHDMTEKGYTLRNGKLDNRNLRYIMKNKTYLGYMRSKKDWIKGLHDPIIDEETFNKVNDRLEESAKQFKESGRKVGTAAISTNLGGLIYCAKCGAKFATATGGSKKYGLHRNYVCYSQNKKTKHLIKDPNCKNKIYKVPILDEIIFKEIKKLAIDPDYMQTIKKRNEQQDEVKQIHAIEDQIKSINSQISRFMDLYGLGRYSIEELDAKTQPLTDQKLKLQQELNRLKEDSQKMTEDDVMELVSDFDQVIEKGDLTQKRAIIEALIDRIEILDEDITIHWNFI
jgi:site-specific DNA recombinase